MDIARDVQHMLIFGTDVFKAADLLFPHCRLDRHHEVLSFLKTTFNLHATNIPKFLNQSSLLNAQSQVFGLNRFCLPG